jgi:hypothetical protein
MPGFDALSVRDLVALVVIASRTMAERGARDPNELVTEAFTVADAFVTQSEGRWATGARANHAARDDKRPKK